jgi:hypothetical protein
MAVVAGTPTIIINNFNVFEALVPLTLSGSYPGTSAGDPLDLTGIVASDSVPLLVEIFEQPPAGTLASGVTWRFAVGTTQANGALQAFVSGASTPAGTIVSTSTAPTITTSSGGVTTALGVAAGALSEVTGATGITGVQAPTITSTFTGTAGTASGLSNLGNVTYASVSAGHLIARCVFKKFL